MRSDIILAIKDDDKEDFGYVYLEQCAIFELVD